MRPLRYVTIMLTLLIVSMSIACSQITLSDYQARNQAEEEIKTVLLGTWMPSSGLISAATWPACMTGGVFTLSAAASCQEEKSDNYFDKFKFHKV